MTPTAPPRHAIRGVSLLRDALWLGGMYAALSLASIYVGRQPGTIATVWPSNALAVAFLVTSPARHAGPLLLVTAAANFLANVLWGDPWVLSLAFVVPNVIEVAVSTWLLRRSGQVSLFAADHRSFLRVLVLGAFVAQGLGASLGAALLHLLSFSSFGWVWLDWYIGSAVGAVATLPIALTLRSIPGTGWWPRVVGWRPVTGALLMVALVVASLSLLAYPFVILSTVLLVVSTLASRVSAFVLSPFVVGVVAVELGFGWFVPAPGLALLGQEQVYLSTLMVIGSAQIVAVLSSRQRALGEILSAVGNRSDGFVVFADMDGLYRWVNRGRVNYFPVANEEALGRSLEENEVEATRRVLAPLLQQAQAGASARIRAELDTPRMGARTLDLVAEPALDEEGRQIGAILCGSDVTELARSRRELERVVDELSSTNADLQQFVHIASHDLREPLNTIAQFCELISATKARDLDEAGQRYFELVHGAALRMRVLLDDVLRYVQLGVKGSEASSSVDLDDVLREVQAALRAQLERSGAAMDVRPLGQVRGHRSLLSLALQNLVSNAVKFVPPGQVPRVQVSAERAGADLRVTVADNGIGIEPDRLSELGAPFRRLHSHRKYEGSGLGLAICKRVTEQLGGRMEIQSTPGAGSQFHLVLPAAGA